jgi:GxxExxY protein
MTSLVWLRDGELTHQQYLHGMHINHVSGQVVDAAIRVHSVLGPGLLERAYQVCLAHELGKRGIQVRAEVPLPVQYDGIELDLAYRIDLLVEACIVVEIKAVARILPIHEAQLLSQLRLSDHRVGLLINFNVARLKDGIVRMVNRL